MSFFRPTKAFISLDNLAFNIRSLREPLAPGTFFCPMIKADAYGHGDLGVAQKLVKEGVETLGVALIEEAISLRQGGITCEILCFASFDGKGAQAILEHSLTAVISDWTQIKALENESEKQDKSVSVHLKFDTGMRRMGFALSEIPKLVKYFSEDHRQKLAGILTHLHSGGDAGDPQGESFEQLRKFQEVEKAFLHLKPISHTLNSSGLVHFIDTWAHKKMPFAISHQQGARPGLAIYGIPQLASSTVKLKPVMSIATETVKYQKVLKGEGVSYSHTWKAKRDSVIAVLPVGYADGYHRILSNRSEVLFQGLRVPLVGNICMDYVMIDVTDAVPTQSVSNLPFQKVVLLGSDDSGNEITANEIAEKAQTIGYEVLTSVSPRVPRIIVGSQ